MVGGALRTVATAETVGLMKAYTSSCVASGPNTRSYSEVKPPTVTVLALSFVSTTCAQGGKAHKRVSQSLSHSVTQVVALSHSHLRIVVYNHLRVQRRPHSKNDIDCLCCG